jgi:hypothetical protein
MELRLPPLKIAQTMEGKHARRTGCTTRKPPTATTANPNTASHSGSSRKIFRKLNTRVILLNTDRFGMTLPTVTVAGKCVIARDARNCVVLLDELHRKALRRMPIQYDNASAKPRGCSSRTLVPSTQMQEA